MRRAWRRCCPIATQSPSGRGGAGLLLWPCAMTVRCFCARRPLKGLLGGMLETPSSPWTESGERAKAVLDHAPFKASWREVPGLVEHTFTHFDLELSVYLAEVSAEAKLAKAAQPERCRWVHVRDLHEAALPSVMRKVLAHALGKRLGLGHKLRPRAAWRNTSIGISVPFIFVLPEGPAVAGVGTLHMRADLVDRARASAQTSCRRRAPRPRAARARRRARCRATQPALDHPAEGNARFGALASDDLDGARFRAASRRRCRSRATSA